LTSNTVSAIEPPAGGADHRSAHSPFDLAFGTLPPNPTPTATVVPTPSMCAGDCNGDGQVLVSELITGVTLPLGNPNPPRTCPAFDFDGSGDVTVTRAHPCRSTTLSVRARPSVLSRKFVANFGERSVLLARRAARRHTANIPRRRNAARGARAGEIW